MSSSRQTRPPRIALTLGLAVLTLLFVGLAVWQVERRAWKHALIAQVGQRASAPAVEAPGRAAWADIDAAHDAYRRVTASGVFLDDRTTFVRAVSVYGSGYWTITPLRRGDGSIVLVNRGFVASDARGRVAAPAGSGGTTTVTGLLRITEPHGGFMTANDPAADRWVSRDVQAIAGARGLADVAPYFIDAEALASNSGVDRAQAAAAGVPVAGLTVVSFTDNHLLYAVIWTLPALLCALAAVFAWRRVEPIVGPDA